MAVAKRGLEESVDWLPFAMIVLGPDGRIAFANAAAAAILAAKDGLARGPRGLVASVPQESRALAALVRDAAQPAHRSSRPRRDVMPVSRRSGREPFTLTIVRLCGLDLIHARVPGCAVGVFIDAPATPILVDGDMLRSMYGFTAAQATIAADVVSGGTVSTIALERRIEPSTVRWHLKDVLLKTQCGSQMELIRMLSRGPAALTPPKA